VGWVVVGAWAFAVLFAVVVLSYAGYEIAWKSARLRGDMAVLNRARGDLSTLQAQLASTQEHVATLRSGH
jgi:hypothetical protein